MIQAQRKSMQSTTKKDSIPFFSIPGKDISSVDFFSKSNAELSGIFDYLDPKFFHLPIERVLPPYLKKESAILHEQYQFSVALKNIFPPKVFSDQEIEEISKKIFSFMKMYAYCNKKNIPIQDCETLLSLIANIYTSDQIIQFGNLMTKTYAVLMGLLDVHHKLGKFNFFVKNPDMLFPEEDIEAEQWGQGSYLSTGVWSYGKQDIPFLPTVRAVFVKDGRHPHHDFEMSVLQDVIMDGKIIVTSEFIDKQVIFTKNGYIDETERQKHQRDAFLYVFNQIKQLSNWHKYSNKYMNTMRCEIKNNRKNKIFSVACRTFKGLSGLDEHWILEIYDLHGKKIGHITTSFQETDFIKHVARPCASFIASYMMSELSVYVYCASKNAPLPHKAVCAPNSNPWSAMRLAGNIHYLPTSSTGQLASSVTMIQPSYFPTRSMNPVLNILVNKKNDSSKKIFNPNLWWDTFQSAVSIKDISQDSYRVEYPGGNYHVDVYRKETNKGYVVALMNDFFEIIQEIFIPTDQQDTNNALGIIALARCMKIRNTPSFEEFGFFVNNDELFWNSKEKMSFEPSIGGTDKLPVLSIPSEPISYAINSSSMTFVKFANMHALNGNLTNYLRTFEANELLDVSQENNSINDYENLFHRVLDFYDSNILSETIIDQENAMQMINIAPIIQAIHSLSVSANKKMIVPQLIKVSEFGEPADRSAIKTQFKFIKIENQKFNFSYTVTLHSEKIPKNTPSPSKTKKIIVSDFSKCFSFSITCEDIKNNPVFIYKPQRQFSFGNVDIFSNIEMILCGYLPDFIFWVNTEGMNAHKSMRISTGNYAKTMKKLSTASKDETVKWDMPFSPDCTMMSAQYETTKSWLTRHFPSLKGMKQGPGHGNIDVLTHLLNCATLVDVVRPDGYCPARQITDDRMARILRIAAVLHDVGKSSKEDGGVGGISEEHPKYSSILSEPFASEFYFNLQEKNLLLKLIKYHDVFGKAQTGKIGSIDEAIAHLAKISGDVLSADMLYHLYRCDVDSIPALGIQGKNVAQEISEHTLVSAEKLLEMTKEYISVNKFEPVDMQEIWMNDRELFSGKKIPTQGRKTILSGEFVQKVNDFSSMHALFDGEKSTQLYNPQYFKKIKSMIKQIKISPDLSYARDLGMHYDGATGSVARCFIWTTEQFINRMFFSGVKNYIGFSYAGIHALVNSPIENKKSLASMLSTENNHEKVIDHKFLLVFDYHAGKIIDQNDLEEIMPIWKKWKQFKNGSSAFSLLINETDMFDMKSLALHLGYSTIKNNDGTIVCVDPRRIAIIGAYEITDSKSQAAPSLFASKNYYGSNPATIEVLLPSGQTEKVLLPKLIYSEIFLETSHTHYFDKNAWDGIPMEESYKKELS